MGILVLPPGFTSPLPSALRQPQRGRGGRSQYHWTAYLRTQQLPASIRGDAQDLLGEYLEARIHGSDLLAGGSAGYASGVAGHRPSAATHVMVGLIVVLVFIIVDLDRPRRGPIEVDQKNFIDLGEAIRKMPAPAASEAGAHSLPR